ncbi:phage tail protein [Sphingomonas hengshuiensis]|uniref:Microcystin-dependent protein n=1 Tax=Sphingomonas hengshuiensis TaxID=1609977 RepID=A0A7U4J9C6_9SPHN|nr:tail fiber protein [Sphingomonas hengshuiensis]AJP72623.1 microcystin-dependent protein [Sphingomonas hengshuiensis]
MSDFFIGQVMMTGFGFAQKYFAQCNGQLLGIAQNNALFSLLGTNYGGNGTTTFALPDLRSRTPAGGGFESSDTNWQPPQYMLGEAMGTETVTLLSMNLPMHTHGLAAQNSPAVEGFPNNQYGFAEVAPAGAKLYGSTPLTVLAPQTVGATGGSQAHPNLQPYQAINFNIALSGIYPSHN